MSAAARWILGVAAALALVSMVIVALLVDGFVLSRGDAATEDLPPSERGAAPNTSVPQVVDVPNEEAAAARSGSEFRQLTCDFNGTSTLEPSLAVGSPFGGSRHRMGLEDGARFDCSDGGDDSAGTIELDAVFESLTAFNGVATGSGSIAWTQVAPAERDPADPTPTSHTAVEIQLDYPVIVVWTTIIDGPYAGFKGRLVLRDWEQLRDGNGDIEGIRFARTTTKFAPT